MKTKRNTKQRQLILDAVLNRYDHPTGDEIYLEVKKLDPQISRATVFRNLKVLSKDGKIKHVKMLNADRYDYRLENHYHFVCLKCGKVIDAPFEYNEDLDEIQDDDFNIKDHQIIFEGICHDCQTVGD